MPTSTAVRPALMRIFQSLKASHIPPVFLIPSFQNASQTSTFSTTAAVYAVKDRDANKQRGVSTRRRTGLRQPLSVAREPLPRPVLDPTKRSKIAVDDDHGLWEFFYSKKKPMNTPEEDAAHGRAWAVEELRAKSWEDLHVLWWECCKERNRIATSSKERQILRAGYGDAEAKERDRAVRITMRGIKHALTERFYSWEDARELAYDDEQIDMSQPYDFQWAPEHFDEEVQQREAEEAEKLRAEAEELEREEREAQEELERFTTKE